MSDILGPGAGRESCSNFEDTQYSFLKLIQTWLDETLIHVQYSRHFRPSSGSILYNVGVMLLDFKA